MYFVWFIAFCFIESDTWHFHFIAQSHKIDWIVASSFATTFDTMKKRDEPKWSRLVEKIRRIFHIYRSFCFPFSHFSPSFSSKDQPITNWFDYLSNEWSFFFTSPLLQSRCRDKRKYSYYFIATKKRIYINFSFGNTHYPLIDIFAYSCFLFFAFIKFNICYLFFWQSTTKKNAQLKRTGTTLSFITRLSRKHFF